MGGGRLESYPLLEKVRPNFPSQLNYVAWEGT